MDKRFSVWGRFFILVGTSFSHILRWFILQLVSLVSLAPKKGANKKQLFFIGILQMLNPNSCLVWATWLIQLLRPLRRPYLVTPSSLEEMLNSVNSSLFHLFAFLYLIYLHPLTTHLQYYKRLKFKILLCKYCFILF